MSSLSLSLLSLLDAANTRPAAAPETTEKESFKALLDIGTAQVHTELEDRQPKQRKENFAAPVEAQASQAKIAEVQQKANPVIGETEPSARDAKEKPAGEQSVSQNAEKADVKKEATPEAPREKTAAEEAEQPAAVVNAALATPVSQPDAPDTRDTLVAQLRGHIEFLSELLRFLQSLGGRVGAVQVGNVTVQVTGVQLTSLIKTEGAAVIGAKGILGSDADLQALLSKIETLPGFADAKPLPGNTPETLLTNIEGVLAKLQSVLPGSANPAELSATPQPMPLKELVAELPSILGTLAQSVRSLAAMLKENPGAQAKLDERIDAVIAQMKDVREALSTLAQKLNGPVITQGKPTEMEPQGEVKAQQPELPADKPVALPVKEAAVKSQAAATAAAPIVADNAADKPVNPPAQAQQAAQAAAASLQANSQSNTSSGGQQHNQAPLPTIAPIRAEAPASQTQAGAAPDFARLVAQAKTPVFEQVAFQIKSQANGASKISIQLQPEALGKVEIKLSVDAHGKTQVQVTAENRQTLDLLQRDARGLERALSDAGLKADSGSLSFNLKGGQQEQHHASSHGAQAYVKPMPDEADEAQAGVITRSYVMEMTEGLDIRI